MSRPGSAPPKERVNIQYTSTLNGVPESVEIPLRTVIVGDFTGQPDPSSVDERRMIRVDKNNFGEVMESFNLSLDLSVPDRLSGQPNQAIQVKLRPRCLNDFTPEGVAAQVPELKQLLDLRKAIRAELKPSIANNRGNIRRRLQVMLEDSALRQRLAAELGVGATDSKNGETEK